MVVVLEAAEPTEQVWHGIEVVARICARSADNPRMKEHCQSTGEGPINDSKTIRIIWAALCKPRNAASSLSLVPGGAHLCNSSSYDNEELLYNSRHDAL